MTAQAHDTVVWRHQDHLLVGVDGTGLFDPVEHGLQTMATTTANWRGWVARYEVQDRLILMELHDVGLSPDQQDTPPILNGVPAQKPGGGWSALYPGLNWPLPFTGHLLIARGFIQSLYRHMGFHPAWKFEESWQLDFDNGTLTRARDLTEEMRTRRESIQAGGVDDPDDESHPGWIERTFRLDFWRSKGR
jgi:hypothetical protein